MIAKILAPMTVRRPVIASASEAIAPSILPISIALAVPIAWPAAPRAKPFATLFFTRKILSNHAPHILPKIPVIITEATVMVITPPNFSLTPIAIGAVTDFGSKVTKNS